ncbi:hypothetical protein K3495_g5947 [Podosphaera aphanis]|nr:hypothetical protein K3495_g5947 [Podosphaera aphanis]
MAPPLVPERALTSDPPDAGNRVSKQKPIASKGSISGSASRSPLKTVEANRKAKAIEKALNLTQCFTDDHDKDVHKVMEESPSNSTDQVFVDGPHGTDGLSLSPNSVNQAAHTSCGSAELMKDIKGLITLTNKYLQDLEKKHSGVGADSLALLSDGASHAMRGQRLHTPPSAKAKEQYELREKTWAQRAACHDREQKSFSIKMQNMRAKPPQGQSKEDRHVKIRLGSEHEARKAGAFELRQTIQKLIPDGNLVSDV